MLLSPILLISASLMLMTAIFEVLDLPLKLTEVLLQVLIHFSHLQVLLFVILSGSLLSLQFFLQFII